MTHFSRRTEALIASGLMAATLACTPLAAFAQAIEPSAEGRTGTGTTEVTVRFVGGASEAGGTLEPQVLPAPEGTDKEDLVDEDGNPDENGDFILNPLYNPDADHDGYGDNLAFSVPATINFVAAPDGTLKGPDAESTYIENLSAFAIRASSFAVSKEDGWEIVDKDSGNFTVANSVDFQFGPEEDQLDAFDYLNQREVGSAQAWVMSPATTNGTGNRVEMETGGHIHNVTNDIATHADKIATIRTYVTPSSIS